MSWSTTSMRRLSRRNMLRAAGSTVAAAAIARVDARSARADSAKPADPLFRALDDKIEAAMARYHVPGVAVGVLPRRRRVRARLRRHQRRLSSAGGW